MDPCHLYMSFSSIGPAVQFAGGSLFRSASSFRIRLAAMGVGCHSVEPGVVQFLGRLVNTVKYKQIILYQISRMASPAAENEDSKIHINLEEQQPPLSALPTDHPDWARADLIILQKNAIEELNASAFPETLEYLDISDNPLVQITGEFNTPNLTHLILSDTLIGKLPLLPESLVQLVITRSPIAEKYGITGDINNKEVIKHISDIPFALGDIVINGEDSQFLMITARRETRDDIIYSVQTLGGDIRNIMKQDLKPYEPHKADMIHPQPPRDANGLPMVYTINGHGEDLLFEKPVPPGCVYVTMEECGKTAKLLDFSRLLMAFQDKPAGILKKLRDPVKYRFELMAHFGRSFHVHYPEAPDPRDRTYLENIHSPWLGWETSRKECTLYKSGVYNLNTGVDFDIELIEDENGDSEYTGGKDSDCFDIKRDDVAYMYNESLFPTFDMVDRDPSITGEPELLFSNMEKYLDNFEFTQSWAFKMFPGIHYNFACRVVKKHPGRNENVRRRRRGSVNAKVANLAQLSNANLRGELGYALLKSYVDSGQNEMIASLIARGIDVNRPNKKGRTLLQEAISSFKIPVIQELMKAPGINVSGALEELEETSAELISRAADEGEKGEIEVETLEIRNLILAPASVGGPVGGKGGKRRRHKTRRSKRKTLKRSTRTKYHK